MAPKKDYLKLRFVLPMSSTGAYVLLEAFDYLAKTLPGRPDSFFSKWSLPRFEDACPEAADQLDANTLAAAQCLYQYCCSPKPHTGYDAPDQLARLDIELATHVSGLIVATRADVNEAPIHLATALVQTAQKQFAADALSFEWGSFSSSSGEIRYGGGAVFVAPGEEPERISTYEWASQREQVALAAALSSPETIIPGE